MTHCALSAETKRRKLPICFLTVQKHNPYGGNPYLELTTWEHFLPTQANISYSIQMAYMEGSSTADGNASG